jgi:hypothetical protein
MEAFLFIAAGLLMAGLTIAASREHGRTRRRLWLEAARASGLADMYEVPSVFGLTNEIVGKADRLLVRIDSDSVDKNRTGTRVVIEGGDRPVRSLTLRPETSATALMKGMGAQGFRIGDKSFDDAFYIEGATAEVYALLDSDTRRDLLTLAHWGDIRVAPGEIRLELACDDAALSTVLPRVMVLLLPCALRLTSQHTLLYRLLGNAQHDPEPGARLASLLVLVREFRNEASLPETLRRACGDASPRIRLHAATALGAEGRPVLVDLAESATDDACAARAIEALGHQLAVERTIAILERALRYNLRDTAQACMKALSAVGPSANSAESRLVDVLERDDVDLRIAAARALGHVATVSAVLPLQEAAARVGTPGFISAARQAVAQIQSRVQGASTGQLSMATADAGRLSMAGAEAGQLAVAESAGGRVSLPEAEPTTAPKSVATPESSPESEAVATAAKARRSS